ncbi:hypothetical protein [Streptomyces sp. NPDC003077]|uniref:hypothetical protein n=1 Tax=Streptomyces sp. NPDC003077 TaxID=3154443 RepID=UPI0033BBE0E2
MLRARFPDGALRPHPSPDPSPNLLTIVPQPEIFDAESEKTTHLTDKIVAIAGREMWPEGEILVHGEQWKSGPGPRRDPAWYGDGDPCDEDDATDEESTVR